MLNAQKLKTDANTKKTHTIYVVRQLAYVHGRAANSYNADREVNNTEPLLLTIALYFCSHLFFRELSHLLLTLILFQGAHAFI